jgi:hypothetical protein
MRSVPPSSSKADRADRAAPAPRRGRLALAAVGFATTSALACALATVAATPACLTRACDPSQELYGLKEGEGRLLDEDTWESSPLDGNWLPYPHQRTWVLFYGGYMKGRTPTSVQVFLSADERPNQSGSNFTQGGGDVVKMYNVTSDSMGLVNGTCADYFVRVVVHAPRAVAPAPALGDAGGDGAAEAGLDASPAEGGSPGDASDAGAD